MFLWKFLREKKNYILFLWIIKLFILHIDIIVKFSIFTFNKLLFNYLIQLYINYYLIIKYSYLIIIRSNTLYKNYNQRSRKHVIGYTLNYIALNISRVKTVAKIILRYDWSWNLAIVNNGVVKWNLKNDGRLSSTVINILEWE